MYCIDQNTVVLDWITLMNTDLAMKKDLKPDSNHGNKMALAMLVILGLEVLSCSPSRLQVFAYCLGFLVMGHSRTLHTDYAGSLGFRTLAICHKIKPHWYTCIYLLKSVLNLRSFKILVR
jgi:hypothetical protein